MNKIKAFTLAEVMVTLALMGVLASIMLPVVKDINPDKNKAAFKKAYYVAERTIYDMVTDDDLYPSLGTYKGFDNTEDALYQGAHYRGKSKFCKLFAAHVNKISSMRPTSCSSDDESFIIVTTDGISWSIPADDFSGYRNNTEDAANAMKIRVDVNGHEHGPNKVQEDRFDIYVKADGRVFVLGDKEKEFIRSSSVQQDN